MSNGWKSEAEKTENVTARLVFFNIFFVLAVTFCLYPRCRSSLAAYEKTIDAKENKNCQSSFQARQQRITDKKRKNGYPPWNGYLYDAVSFSFFMRVDR